MMRTGEQIYHCNDWNQDTKVSCTAWCLERQKSAPQHKSLDKTLIPQLSSTFLSTTVSYLQSRAFVWGPLAGSFPFEAQLNEKLQQVDEQLVHHLLSLKIGRYITQGIYHSQGAVSTRRRGEI